MMTGRKYKRIFAEITPDELRKKGEQGKLVNDIFCTKYFGGFHHSWLGDSDFVRNKMNAYAHSGRDHNDNALGFINDYVKSGRSLFPNTELVYDRNINLLQTVESLRNILPCYFWGENS